MSPQIMIALIIVSIVLLVTIPVVIIGIFYYKSFNRRVLNLREIGSDPNNANFTIARSRIESVKLLGQVVRFWIGSGYPRTKRYATIYWTAIRIGKNRYEGLPLYWQGNNPRPLQLVVDDSGETVLEVVDEDNREFMMDEEIYKHETGEDSKLMLGSIITVCIALVLLSCLFVGSIIIMQSNNVAAAMAGLV